MWGFTTDPDEQKSVPAPQEPASESVAQGPYGGSQWAARSAIQVPSPAESTNIPDGETRITMKPMSSHEFLGFEVRVGSTDTDSFTMRIPRLSHRVKMADVNSISLPSQYILGARKALSMLVTKVMTENATTLAVRWNMEKRAGRHSVCLCDLDNGYYNETSYHSFSESGMIVEPNRYPLTLLLFGVDKYKAVLGLSEQEYKALERKPKFIQVFEEELRRFPMPSALDILTAVFRRDYEDQSLNVTATFEAIMRDDSGAQYGRISVLLNF